MPGPLLPGMDESRFIELSKFLLSAESAEPRDAAQRLRLMMDLGDATEGRWPAIDTLQEPQRQVSGFVQRWTVGAEPEIPLAWLGPQERMGADVFAYRARAAQMIAVGAYLLTGDAHFEGEPKTILELAFGMDALHVVIGDFLGAPPAFPDPPQLPPGLGSLGDALRQFPCVGEIQSALAQFGAVGMERPHHMSGARIDQVDPRRGCPGTIVTIRGAGFGASQPANVIVSFTSRGGGCTHAEVVSWSDSAIRVIVPNDVGHGCVGLIESSGGFANVGAAAENLAGALESCLGLAASGAAGHIRHIGSQLALTCPECDNPNARFDGGKPEIAGFLANNRVICDIHPGDAVSLAWQVIDADRITISAQGNAALPAVSQPLSPAGGSVNLGAIRFQDGDSGEYVLTATNPCGSVIATVEIVCRGKQGLVLSGGGSKGAFEIGAVRCLHDAKGWTPDIIAGASAGSLNAAKLAEGPAALAQAEAAWLGLSSSDDFYLKPGWVGTLEPIIQELFQSSASNIGTGIGSALASFAARKMLGVLADALAIPGYVFTLATSLYPAVTLAIDAVRFFSAVGQALGANSIFDPAPLVTLIRNNVDPAKVAGSGIRLRITAVSLESGLAEVIDENGVIQSSGFRIPLRSAVLASAAIPVAFPPVAISGTSHGTEHFIDGGTRNNVPIKMAVAAGADRVLAILLSPRGNAFSANFANAKLKDIAPRAFDILMDELQEEDVAPFRGFGVPLSVAAPSFLVHDTLTVDPGLIAINMDYGYMRAYDDLVASAADRRDLRRSSDEIIGARIEAWTSEFAANGERLGPTIRGVHLALDPYPLALQDVRGFKNQIRALTKDRVKRFGPQSVPYSTAPWWQEFERHSWQPFIPSPWSSLTSPAGTLAAAPVPPP